MDLVPPKYSQIHIWRVKLSSDWEQLSLDISEEIELINHHSQPRFPTKCTFICKVGMRMLQMHYSHRFWVQRDKYGQVIT